MKKIRKIKLPPKDWILVLLLTIFLYIFSNILLPKIHQGFVSTYVIKPAAWGLLVFYISRLPKQRSAAKKRLRGILIKIALGIGLFQIYLGVIAGFMDKFGKSPNSFTPTGIIINLIFVATSLLGLELARAWLINRRSRKSKSLPYTIGVLFTFLCLPLNKFSNLTASLESVTKFLGSDFLPTLMENLLTSFLAMWGGPLPAIAYRGVLAAFKWFSPILPDLNWAMKALTGTVVPVVGLILVHQYVLFKQNPGKAKKTADQGVTSWIILSIAAVISIWFSLGVFPVRPTVIISGSMRPTIEVGDVAIVAKKNTDLLKTGDIIQFRTDKRDIPTVHRIIQDGEISNKKIFITKGDNNDSRDPDPVFTDQVVGEVIFIVPKVGWGSIWARELLA